MCVVDREVEERKKEGRKGGEVKRRRERGEAKVREGGGKGEEESCDHNV